VRHGHGILGMLVFFWMLWASTSVGETLLAAPRTMSFAPTIRIASPLSNHTYSGRITVQAIARNVASVAYQVGTHAPVAMRHEGDGHWSATLDAAALGGRTSHVTVTGRTAGGTTVQDRAWNVRFGTSAVLGGVNVAGAEFGTLPGKLNHDYVYPTAAQLQYWRDQGASMIRLPFRWERIQRTLYGPLDAAELAAIDTVAREARARELRLILDMHNYARYHDKLIGTADVPNAAFADVWRKLAAHFHDESGVWAYGLMNEPHDTGGRWPAAAQAALDAVRAVDMTHTVLVAGDGWSSAHQWAHHNVELRVTDPANNMLYEAHLYFDRDASGTYAEPYDASGAYPAIGVDRLKPFVDWLAARNARGFVGEVGVPDDDARWLTALDTTLAFLDANRIGTTYWAAGAWWGDYPLAVEPRSDGVRPQLAVLRRYWTAQGAR
jgi:endoglucanase